MISGDISNSTIEHVIDEYVHSKRDRAILKRRLIDNALFEELAEEFELSVRQCKYIVYRCQESIFKHL